MPLTEPSSAVANRKENAIRAASAIFGGFAFFAAFNAVAITLGVRSPSLTLTLLCHTYDAAETLGLGAVIALTIFACVRFIPMSELARTVGAWLIATAIGYRVMGAYLTIVAAHVWQGRIAGPIYIAMILALGVSLAGAPVLALELLERRIVRGIPIPFAVAVLTVDQLAFRDDYFDAHGILALGTLLFAGTALESRTTRSVRTLGRSHGGRLLLAGVGLFGLFGLASAPSNAVRFELFRQPCAIAPWTLATLVWPPAELHAKVTVPDSPWYSDRSNAPAIPPTQPPIIPSDSVVVLLTLDAIRADVLTDSKYDDRFPTLTKLKTEGVVFTHASSPATQTEISMTTLFSGRYFSELAWKDSGKGWTFHPHPTVDHFIRFPELLSAHGVTTVNLAGIAFLTNEFGVVRGFREETRMLHERTAESAFNLIGAMSDRLSKDSQGRMFLCTHLTESHSPYAPGKAGDADYERYLTAITYLDGQVGHIQRLLEKNFHGRWVLIVSSDHGEAFGQHQTTEHGKTLYEDLLHVPLIVRSPFFAPRVIDTRVGLIDLGPTILDLFGVDTPATFNGESLVPFLGGRTPTLSRPLLAEGRLRRSLTEPDGLKVIDDPRRKVVEVYDLNRDPGETHNLFDAEPARSDRALAELRAFFAARAWQSPGYAAPYKP